MRTPAHPLAPCRVILLDMDGTLVDSHEAIESAWTAWACDNGLDPAVVGAVCHGPDAVTTVRRFLPGISEAELAEHVAIQVDRESTDTGGVRAAVGAHELLAWLDGHGVAWGVVTNAGARLARARLGAAGIEPPLCVTFDDVEHGKPHPDGYLLGARRLGAEPWQVAAVEDSASGLAAARAAGTVVVAVGGAQEGDVVCRDLRELRNRLAAVWSVGPG